MSNSKPASGQTKTHTPGPWVAVKHNQLIGKNLAGRWRITAKARKAEIKSVLDYECDLIAILPTLSIANARLIAASPDLLKACKYYMNEIWKKEPDLTEARIRFTDAIALAKKGE